MIELGLSRIAQLIPKSSLGWKAIHVAGTNGKGSIVGYLSSMLTAGGVRCGSFTSPHLIDRWDCITINERVVQESVFRRIESQVKQRDQTLGLGATEFELLTATAFEIFQRENVEVGVVEVGVGGRLDATNILANVLVSVISKIGYDHQALLGNTIEEIAREKAGIIKPHVPCVVDGTNPPEVREVIRDHAKTIGAPVSFVDSRQIAQTLPALCDKFEALALPPHQRENLSCAVTALQASLPQIRPHMTVDQLLQFISKTPRPGRLQEICLKPLVPRDRPVILDGAHNAQSAEALVSYVDRNLRVNGEKVTWLLAASQGKNIQELFGGMIQPEDGVAVVEFGPVAGMPWVQSVSADELAAKACASIKSSSIGVFGANIPEALKWVTTYSAGGPVVIAGSLYLVSDVLRLLREAQAPNS